MSDTISAALAPVAERLEADLRLVFPDIEVSFVRDDEGYWWCQIVDEGLTSVPSRSVWLNQDGTLADDVEDLISDLATAICDNWWPDELQDPWPECPRHGGHPLQPLVTRGVASWTCTRDPSVALRVGSLQPEGA